MKWLTTIGLWCLNIPVKDVITYLVIVFNKNQDTRCSLILNPNIEKTQKKYNWWLQRDVTLRGRILLTKAEGVSHLTYAALHLDVNKQISKATDSMHCNFMWKNKTCYGRKSVLMNSYEHGGLNLLDFPTLNSTFKINWIKQFFRNPTSIGILFSNYLYSKLGGLKFVLLCSYNVEIFFSQLSNFHKQMLLFRPLLYKHNFSPHRYYIVWINRDMLYKHISLFSENWYVREISLVVQLINSGYSLM